jgi:hypothetical protein
VSKAPRDRPWQVVLTGQGLEQIDAWNPPGPRVHSGTLYRVPGLVVHTVAGKLSVTRDFQSDYTAQVDRYLQDIFKNNAAVTGIECLGLEHPHTATPDDPYWSADGKACASIEQAAALGEITPGEAIVAYRRLAAVPE